MNTNHQIAHVSEYNYLISSRLSGESNVICQRNKQQAIRFFNHDFSEYEDIVSEDIWIHGPASGQETKGIVAAKGLDTGYATAFPNAQYKINDIFAAGDKVVVRWSMQGTQTGERKGFLIGGRTQDIPPTNREVVINGIHIYRFNNEGKIIESWAMWDRLGELEQITNITISSK